MRNFFKGLAVVTVVVGFVFLCNAQTGNQGTLPMQTVVDRVVNNTNNQAAEAITKGTNFTANFLEWRTGSTLVGAIPFNGPANLDNQSTAVQVNSGGSYPAGSNAPSYGPMRFEAGVFTNVNSAAWTNPFFPVWSTPPVLVVTPVWPSTIMVTTNTTNNILSITTITTSNFTVSTGTANSNISFNWIAVGTP